MSKRAKNGTASRSTRRARAGLVGAVILMGALAGEAAALTRTVTFSGREWTVKAHPSPLGPGPNLFSASAENVWVDARGRLHLRITRTAQGWACAEVIGTASLGYGTYSWTLDSAADALPPSAVLGLFTWSDAPDFAHREIDIEFARWGRTRGGANAQYVVQPYKSRGHLRSFQQPPTTSSRHQFTWSPGRVDFASSSGSPGSWTYLARDVPPAGDERPRMNLWLLDGVAPADGRAVEVVIKSFSFTPAGARPLGLRRR